MKRILQIEKIQINYPEIIKDFPSLTLNLSSHKFV